MDSFDFGDIVGDVAEGIGDSLADGCAGISGKWLLAALLIVAFVLIALWTMGLI